MKTLLFTYSYLLTYELVLWLLFSKLIVNFFINHRNSKKSLQFAKQRYKGIVNFFRIDYEKVNNFE